MIFRREALRVVETTKFVAKTHISASHPVICVR
jgi:hypothetical protein